MAYKTSTKTKVDALGRVCTNCLIFKQWEYYNGNSNGVNGKQSRCKQCCREYLDGWRSRNPEKFRRVGWAYELRKLYGITVDQYYEMLDAQGGACAICGLTNITSSGAELIKNGKTTNFHVDHDHTTGKVRGILCNACNRGLGYFRDDVQLLDKAIKYLIKQ